jgi:c(7)-type cytochrome triheme protein
MKKTIPIVAALWAFFVLVASASGRVLPSAENYGEVVISNQSAGSQLPAVRFDHWLHRAFFTCRLCHVDLGFAMEKNATKITAEADASGLYCGSCHNGTMRHDGKTVFRSCSPDFSSDDKPRCLRCHYSGKEAQRTYKYESFTTIFPKLKIGHLVDWEAAEGRGFIRPVDTLPGPSPRRPPLKAQSDFSIASRGTWMSDIIFSHQKHAVWNGCEVCHPEVFPSVKKNTVKYSMFQISGGEYCGVCHGSVAFPLEECQRCHAAKGTPGSPKDR